MESGKRSIPIHRARQLTLSHSPTLPLPDSHYTSPILLPHHPLFQSTTSRNPPLSLPPFLMAPNIPLRTFSAAELSAATSDFSPSSLLGRGSHSTVHLAVLDSGRLLAAAKLPSPSSSPSISAHEISLLSSLPRTPFLVNLLGVSSSIAVVDLMPLGSLHLHLHQSPPLPFPRRLSLALRAAMAVDSLHRLGIAHRDLKPTNLLLDSLGRPRLADFGLAARLADADLPPPAGTLGYLDPSYVKPSDLSTKTDVYSFGVILFEILSGRRGFDVEYSPPALVEWAAPLVAEGKFDEIWEKGAGPWKGRAEEEAARMVAEVAARCVEEEAVARPKMEEVVRCLREARRRARPRAAAMVAAWRRVGKWAHGLARNGKVSDVAP